MPRSTGLALVLGTRSVVADERCMVDPLQQTYPKMRTSGAVKVSEVQERLGLTVVNGGQSQFRGRRRGRRTVTAAELYLDREMQTAFVSWEGRDGTVPSEAVQKIREGAQHPWRLLARRFIEAHAAGVPLSYVLRTLDTLRTWVVRLYDVKGETVTEHITYNQGPRYSGPFLLA